MSVPTTNLYNFVHQAAENKFLLRYFYPWGHKNIYNLILLIDENLPKKQYGPTWDQLPLMICHDQEPLNFEMYDDETVEEELKQHSEKQTHLSTPIYNLYKGQQLNLLWCQPCNFYNYAVLLHSELNSANVIRYESTGNFKSVYWWSHALIARDWYRFAEHDIRLQENAETVATWLVYARDTTGKRTYRKTFLELIKNTKNVQIGSIDNTKSVSSDSSAEYDCQDYTKTKCSVVLETCYDQRIHLTEKTLRPIACGHPFVVLAGPGTLKYLRTHGFKTFHPFIDESYDDITDDTLRMSMVVEEMNRINNLPLSDQERIWKACAVIARHNKELFFSNSFYKSIVNEFKTNLKKLPENNLSYKKIRRFCRVSRQVDPESVFRESRRAVIRMARDIRKSTKLPVV